MDFVLVILYAIFNVVFLCYLWRRHSILSPGMIVLSFYVLVSVLAVPAYDLLPLDAFFSSFDFRHITILPYIFYFFFSYMLIVPIFAYKNKLQPHRVRVDVINVKLFVYGFTFLSMIAIYVYARMLVSNSIMENLDVIRQENYAGVQIKAYNNVVEHVALLFNHYFDLPAKILFFYILTNERVRRRIPLVLLLLFGIGAIVPGIMDASRTASRVMAVNVIIELVLCYSIFRTSIPKKVKYMLYGAFLVFCVIMASYTYLVTKARFGSQGDDSTFNSLICYLGQPTLIFNSQVSQIREFAWGARFFYPVYELLGAQPDLVLSRVTRGWDVCFSTMVGDLWQDFSVFIVIIIPLIAGGFLKWLKRKKSLGIAEIYIMMFYAKTILRGALVTGYGMCIDIMVALLMYIFMKYYFSRKKHKRHVKNYSALPSPVPSDEGK